MGTETRSYYDLTLPKQISRYPLSETSFHLTTSDKVTIVCNKAEMCLGLIVWQVESTAWSRSPGRPAAPRHRLQDWVHQVQPEVPLWPGQVTHSSPHIVHTFLLQPVVFSLQIKRLGDPPQRSPPTYQKGRFESGSAQVGFQSKLFH